MIVIDRVTTLAMKAANMAIIRVAIKRIDDVIVVLAVIVKVPCTVAIIYRRRRLASATMPIHRTCNNSNTTKTFGVPIRMHMPNGTSNISGLSNIKRPSLRLLQPLSTIAMAVNQFIRDAVHPKIRKGMILAILYRDM